MADEAGRDTILVYRDCIVPRSEAHFLRRLYIGFERLAPVWIGRKTGDGLADLGSTPLLLGAPGLRGLVERALFKQFGILPASPDLRAMRPRLVHAHFGRGGALALPIARALRVPLVVTFHGGDATKDTHYRRRLVPTVFQRRLPALQREAALIICVSDFIRDQLLARGFPPDKLVVHHYGIEPDDEIGGDPADGPVLFAGRFVAKKGVACLIDAMGRLQQAGGAARLVLVGDGPLAGELRHQAAPLRNVEFAGWLPQREVRRLMRGALAVCVPSLRAADGDADGLPNVVLEAMAAGAPIVASHSAGIAEAVEHGRTGLLVPEGDPQALADALASLVAQPDLRRRLGAAARATARERFGALAQSRRLEALLLRVIAEAPQCG
jgi:glycosyltransferase involved in cell wall biosynthesis